VAHHHQVGFAFVLECREQPLILTRPLGPGTALLETFGVGVAVRHTARLLIVVLMILLRLPEGGGGRPWEEQTCPVQTNGSVRPLGIPTYEDKLVLGVMAKVLTEVYEPRFLDLSDGFKLDSRCLETRRILDLLTLRNERYSVLVALEMVQGTNAKYW